MPGPVATTQWFVGTARLSAATRWMTSAAWFRATERSGVAIREGLKRCGHMPACLRNVLTKTQVDVYRSDNALKCQNKVL